jgi:hypothetical protein
MEYLPIQVGDMPTSMKTIGIQASGRATADSLQIINQEFGLNIPISDKPFDRRAELMAGRCLHSTWLQ